MSVTGDGPGDEKLLAVGKIIRPHGVRGAVVVEAISDFPGRFGEGSRLLLEGPKGDIDEVVVLKASPHKGRLLVFLGGVDDRQGAELLRGRYLWIGESRADRLGEGEYWVHDLVGMKVLSEDGRLLGEVEDVIERAVQDSLSVACADERTFQVPLVGEFVRRIDVEGRNITVRLPEGMGPD